MLRAASRLHPTSTSSTESQHALTLFFSKSSLRQMQNQPKPPHWEKWSQPKRSTSDLPDQPQHQRLAKQLKRLKSQPVQEESDHSDHEYDHFASTSSDHGHDSVSDCSSESQSQSTSTDSGRMVRRYHCPSESIPDNRSARAFGEIRHRRQSLDRPKPTRENTPIPPSLPNSRKVWTMEEFLALFAGMRKYGTRWSQIKEDPEFKHILKDRSPSSLFGKARNERRARERYGYPLEIFELVSSPGPSGADFYVRE